MKYVQLGMLLASAVFAPLSVASAGTLQTRMTLENIAPNVDFLDRSSRLALDHSKDARLRTYARGVASEQTIAANALYDLSQAARTQVASRDASNPDGLMTGRSAAIGGQVALSDNRLPLGQEDLDQLDGLDGKDFDQQFKTKQIEALTQVETDYADYIAKGDDPVLLGIASRELPIVRHQLAALRKI